jgi:predicted dehydrogenase
MVGRTREKSRQISNEFGIGFVWANADDVFSDTSIDAVILAVPPSEIAELAIAAFSAGKHVMCEKPLGISVEEAERVAAACERSGKIGAINFCYKFHPALQRFRKCIEAGVLGKLNCIDIRWVLPNRLNDNLTIHWKGQEELGGGVLQNFGVHLLDYLFSESSDVQVLSVVQKVVHPYRPNVDRLPCQSTGDENTTALLLWRGVPIQMHLSLVTMRGNGLQMEASGTSGTVKLEEFHIGDNKHFSLHENFRKEGVNDSVSETNQYVMNLSELFKCSQKEFMTAISSNVNAGNSIKRGVCAAKIISAIQSAAKINQNKFPHVRDV